MNTGVAKQTRHAEVVGDVADEEYIAVTEGTFVGVAVERFMEFEPADPEETTLYYVYVVDDEDRLVGVVSFRQLVNAPEDDLVSEHMERDVRTLDSDEDIEQAAMRMSELEFPALPVVDGDGVLRGVARSDDMLEVVEDEATEDILKRAGMSFVDVESVRSTAILESSVSQIVRLRLPWLILALAGGLLAGAVIGGFEAQLEATLALAFFVPVIMDMGGNVGTQASTIFVRGLALGDIDDRNAVRHFLREGLVGLVIGLIVGTLGAGAGYIGLELLLDEADAALVALSVWVGLVSVCVVASVVGYVIPWVMHKLGYDPAAASDPLITTVKDITALLIYFSIAAVLIGV